MRPLDKIKDTSRRKTWLSTTIKVSAGIFLLFILAQCTIGSTRISPRITRRTPPILTFDPNGGVEAEAAPGQDEEPFHIIIRGTW